MQLTYPKDYIGKIICGDCLEIMKGIPDKSIDIVLTDPPYQSPAKYYDTRKNYPKTLCTIKIKGKSAITCTESHPIFTKRNYLTSCELNSRDTMLCIDSHDKNSKELRNENGFMCTMRKSSQHEKQNKVLSTFLPRMQNQKKKRKTKSSDNKLLRLWKRNRMQGEQALENLPFQGKTWNSNLFRRVYNRKNQRRAQKIRKTVVTI